MLSFNYGALEYEGGDDQQLNKFGRLQSMCWVYQQFYYFKTEHLIQYCCWSLSTTIELHSSTLTRCVVMQVVIILPGNGALNN